MKTKVVMDAFGGHFFDNYVSDVSSPIVSNVRWCRIGTTECQSEEEWDSGIMKYMIN
jgi:hypothetical protein